MNKSINSSGNKKVQELLRGLCSNNGIERQKARKTLVANGKEMIEYLGELLNQQKYIYRWEAIKTLEEIGDADAIPLFIKALEDDKSDVRWIAAEGLIKLGMLSVKPLLKTLLEKSDYIFILAGIHHIFYELKEKEILPVNFPVDKLLNALRNTEEKEALMSMAFELLNNY